MLDLDEQLREYGAYLNELAPGPRALAETDRSRWRAVATAALAAAVVVGVVAVAARSGTDRSATTAPVGSVATGSGGALANAHPTVDQQVAQLGRWYKDANADAPGGRTVLTAEFEFCDFRWHSTDRGDTGVQRLFASYFPLGESLTPARIVDGCLRHDPEAALVETPAGALPQHVLCATRERDPVYSGPDATHPVLKPAVVFGDTGCRAAGYEPFPGSLLSELNRRREVEIEIRAVPRSCPTEAEATLWVHAVTARALGRSWPIAGELATEPRIGGGCFRPEHVEWDTQRVALGQF